MEHLAFLVAVLAIAFAVVKVIFDFGANNSKSSKAQLRLVSIFPFLP